MSVLIEDIPLVITSTYVDIFTTNDTTATGITNTTTTTNDDDNENLNENYNFYIEGLLSFTFTWYKFQK